MRPLLAFFLLLLLPSSALAVTGGRLVTDADHGYAVRVNLVDTTCGGTLIAPDWVLTAAHCSVVPGGAEFPDPGLITVYAGRLKTSDTSAGVEVGVSRVLAAPGYAGVVALNLTYPDVALLQLTEPVPYRTLQIAGPDEAGLWAPGVVGEVAAWGSDATSTSPSDVLRAVSLPVIDDAVCDEQQRGSTVNVGGSEVARTGRVDLEHSFCVGERDSGRGICSGDSGAGFVVPAYGGLRIAGIVSEGSCGGQGIFARVAAAKISAWVESVVPGSVGTPPPPPPPAPPASPAPAAAPPAPVSKPRPTAAERRRAAARRKRAAAKRRAAARRRAAKRRKLRR